jgi:hypothetical protein
MTKFRNMPFPYRHFLTDSIVATHQFASDAITDAADDTDQQPCRTAHFAASTTGNPQLFTESAKRRGSWSITRHNAFDRYLLSNLSTR